MHGRTMGTERIPFEFVLSEKTHRVSARSQTTEKKTRERESDSKQPGCLRTMLMPQGKSTYWIIDLKCEISYWQLWLHRSEVVAHIGCQTIGFMAVADHWRMMNLAASGGGNDVDGNNSTSSTSSSDNNKTSTKDSAICTIL